MSKIYIHIGLQKTATTYLQSKVFPSIQDLLYVGRPYTQENQAFNALQYADDALYDSSLLVKEMQNIKRTASGKPVLISDELFSGFAFWGFLNRGLIARRLSQVVPEAEIILFIRNQTDLIDSLYNQYVKTGWYSKTLGPDFLHEPGSGLSLDDWLTDQNNWDYNRRRFKHRAVFSPEVFLYSESIKLYKTLFPKVHVFLYEDFKEDPHRQLQRLESIFGLAINNPVAQKKGLINQGLKDKEIQHRLLENRLTAINWPSNFKLRKVLARVLNRFHKEQSHQERLNYIRNSLRNAGVFLDNRQLLHMYREEMPKLSYHYLEECDDVS